MRIKIFSSLEHLLFAAYLILFAWIVTKVRFFSRSGLTTSQLIIIFLLKVMAGIFYGWIGVYYGELAQMVDTWFYHFESVKEYDLLLSNPHQFFTSIFHDPYDEGYSGFFSTRNSWWNDLKGTFLLKILALFNVLSAGNYYINVIFFSFLTLFGPVAIYRVMIDVFPARKIAVLLATFLVPSFIYWTSGIHKDGLIFVGFALLTYLIYFGLKQKHFSFLRIAGALCCLVLVLALRNFLVITLIPALLAWILSARTRFRPIYIFLTTYFLFVLFFFTARYVHPAADLPQSVADRQKEFVKLHGRSAVEVDLLDPSFKGFVINAPQALSLAAIRPYPADVKHLLSLAAAMEINLILLFFLIFLLLRNAPVPSTPFILYCLFLSFSVLMMIGYTVNFLGAIVRYRSIILPFLIVPMAACINWGRLGELLLGEIKNKNNV